MSQAQNLRLTTAGREDFDVRSFEIREGLHALFRIDLVVVARDPDVDFERIVGQACRFEALSRVIDGVCATIEQTGIEADHLSTYRITIVPALWLLTQRRNYRVFQHMSEPDIVLAVLSSWGIEPRRAFDASDFKARKYRVQYAETDFAFVSRLLEDAGITFYFEQSDGGTRLVLSDRPNRNDPRPSSVAYVNAPTDMLREEYATAVRVARHVRPGRYTQRDIDYRRPPTTPLVATAALREGVEASLERYHHNYGAFLFHAEPDGSSPVADDLGAARTDLEEGARQAQRRLDAQRASARTITFLTTAHDLAPGAVTSLAGYPRAELADDVRLLVSGATFRGDATGAFSHQIEARFATQDFRPALETPKPRTQGVESATVVGPELEDIHTDEFGRVRVQFHWDREGGRNERSSCWIPVSQAWGGASFGAVSLPRVGQEVLVDFLGADPDRPVVVGRVFTQTQPLPYALPRHKTVSGIRSETSPRLVMGGAEGGEPAVAPDSILRGGAPMSLSDLTTALGTAPFAARSPGGQTHQWRGSELTFDDRAGNELAYLQAQRDLNLVVRNAWTTVVGNHRATLVGTDDILTVRNKQQIEVQSDRKLKVGGEQEREIAKDDKLRVLGAQQEETVGPRVAVCHQTFVLQSGADTYLVLHPDFAILQSKKVFINPGLEATRAAIASGRPPSTADEDARAAAEAEARRAAAFREAALAINREMDPFRVGVHPGNPAARAYQAAEEATDPMERAYQRMRSGLLTEGRQTISDRSLALYRQGLMDGHFGRLTPDQADRVIDRVIGSRAGAGQ